MAQMLNSLRREFEVPYRPNMNVISAFMEIQRNPVNAKGRKQLLLHWEMNCLEEVCGACSMVINGKPRQACTALVDKLGATNSFRANENIPCCS